MLRSCALAVICDYGDVEKNLKILYFITHLYRQVVRHFCHLHNGFCAGLVFLIRVRERTVKIWI